MVSSNSLKTQAHLHRQAAKVKNHYFFKDFIDLYLERGEGREKEREKHQCVVASHVAPTRDLACNPGMCPDWASNQWPFGSQPVLNSLTYTSLGKNHYLERTFSLKIKFKMWDQ